MGSSSFLLMILICLLSQVVPSQRIARKIGVHPFNIYQQLRNLNPSRYTFYVDCGEFQLGPCSYHSFQLRVLLWN